MNNSPSFQGLLRLLLLTIAIAGCISLAADHHAQKQGARTETSTSYDKDGTLVTTETDYDAQNHIVEIRELKGGKLRKRTRFTWPKDFKKPNSSTTEYHPDGTTPSSITNSDVDKDGSPTSSVTTTYDPKGNEIGGSKREVDPKTAKEHCYNWNPSKQVYEEVECPKKPWVSSVGDDNAKVETGGGLIKVNFTVEGGRVIVNLPDDMRAGDTISGTAIEESDLSPIPDDAFFVRQLYIDFLHREPEPPGLQHGLSIRGEKGSAAPPVRFTVDVPESQSMPIILRDKDGNSIGSITLPLIIVPPVTGSTAPSSFPLPTIGQQGRGVEIFGRFERNTQRTLNWTAIRSQIQDFEKNTENVSGGFGLIDGQPIAESPRKAVFQCPTNVTGPIEITLTDGNKKTMGTFRNVGVNLSAPKTNLVRGEHTTLTIQVTGLQGIKEPVPLKLESHGVITMEGGLYQSLMIQPSQVGADGRYSTTRGITGLQTGAWRATATIVTKR